MYYDPNYQYFGTPQGWQCPICGRIYSPTTSMCFYCDNRKIVNSPNINTTDDSAWWQEYLKQSQTGKPAFDNPSITTATTTTDPNVKITTWNSATTCKQKCEECDKYGKSCFGGTETTSSKAIISHRKPLETYYECDFLNSFIKHFQD